jgi:carbon-monoxide dehydrogenase large subunit
MFVGTALTESAAIVIERGKQIASHVLEASPGDIEFQGGRFVIAGTDRSIGLIDLAARLRAGINLPGGTPGSLDVDHVVNNPVPSAFPNGCHIAEVEVDPETGAAHVVRYSAVNDLGTVVNPLLVEGQVQGGVVQGLGQVERGEGADYDSDGQLVTGSFMDYAMPRAHDTDDQCRQPSCADKKQSARRKGCGEAGTSGGLPPWLMPLSTLSMRCPTP